MDIQRTIRISIIALFIALIAGLGGWYWYLKSKGDAIQDLSVARGLNESAPRFSGGTGSTLENIVQGLGFQKEGTTESAAPPRMWRALATPGAGHGFIGGATSTRLRFLERSTGYLFETDVRTGKTERLTNTLMPQVYEAAFTSTGNPIVTTLVAGKPESVALTYTATTSREFGDIAQKSLGATIATAVHPTKQEILTLVDDGREAALIRSQWNGSAPSRVFSSLLRGWRLQWLADNTIYLSQLPATGIPGGAYRVEGSSLVPIVQSVPGLTILPRASSPALLIGTDDGTISLTLRRATSTITLPIRTVPDKCVWAPGTLLVAYCAVPQSLSTTRYIDAWYRGALHTSDTWWKVDGTSGEVEELFSTNQEDVLDVENPHINDTGEYISFRNAYDKSIWVLRIKE